jgi:hypothetical protein
MPFDNFHAGTKFLGTKFLGTKFLGTKFLGTKFLGTKFLGTKFVWTDISLGLNFLEPKKIRSPNKIRDHFSTRH